MKRESKIITVGLSPTWDITSQVENPDWGGHINIDEQTIFPAGKALNVSKALAWMGQEPEHDFEVALLEKCLIASLTNGPGTISAQGAKLSTSADSGVQNVPS